METNPYAQYMETYEEEWHCMHNNSMRQIHTSDHVFLTLRI